MVLQPERSGLHIIYSAYSALGAKSKLYSSLTPPINATHSKIHSSPNQ